MKILLSLLVLLSLSACGGSSSTSSTHQNPTPINNSENDDGSTNNASPMTFGEPTNSQIRPGVEVISADNSSCTSNFLYYLNSTTVYIGAAAHCFSPDANTGTDPCETENLAIGSPVTIANATQPGLLAYSSWAAMQQVGEDPGNAACDNNDFALIRINPADLGNIHPAVVGFGGPTALRSDTASIDETVYGYGQSIFHLGVQELETRQGKISDIRGEGWLYAVTNSLPGLGVPGDSGGPVMDANGRALGVTSVLSFSLPSGATNGIVNLKMALDYAKQNGFINPDVTLITWQDFSTDGVVALPTLGL
ncbi:trypsin-like peptidase domain-containing protein [Spongiibacter sp. KMU-158]|uniref:Trypsin-like peptidase domain-containing protein n=1 Tax=Spongiibacter pelagi TaxID=2760804 RepID=A0A927GXP9_9GAMM|nr:trypsin-like peptidase domain-containing protein [Spongiibacter pelagi]MBD2860237.1 trypsin-like peptidase domain-containing protein [Spongiibacter pelagi]